MATSANRRANRAARRPRDPDNVKQATKIARRCRQWVLLGVTEQNEIGLTYGGVDSAPAAAILGRQLARGISVFTGVEIAKGNGLGEEAAQNLAEKTLTDAEGVERENFYGYDPHPKVTLQDIARACESEVSMTFNAHLKEKVSAEDFLLDMGVIRGSDATEEAYDRMLSTGVICSLYFQIHAQGETFYHVYDASESLACERAMELIIDEEEKFLKDAEEVKALMDDGGSGETADEH